MLSLSLAKFHFYTARGLESKHDNVIANIVYTQLITGKLITSLSVQWKTTAVKDIGTETEYIFV